MSDYIVCQKKRNNPRMDVRICEKKCPSKEDCKAFLACHKGMEQAKDLSSLIADPGSPELAAA